MLTHHKTCLVFAYGFYEWNKKSSSPLPYGFELRCKGEKLLPEIIKEAMLEFGHWTDDQLNDYKMSHGHCVKSKY